MTNSIRTKLATVAIIAISSMSLMPTVAFAELVDIKAKPTQGELKKTCDAIGGESYESFETFGCRNPKKGTNVSCLKYDDHSCAGYVPRLVGNKAMPLESAGLLRSMQ